MQTKELRKRISLTVFLLGTLFSVSKAEDQVTMDLSLNIVNTFSGSFEINGTAKTKNGITYIKQNPTLIRISSDVAGEYSITGDFQGGILSGTESTGYITSLPMTLNHITNSLHLQFFKGGEVLLYPTITLQLDTTPPNKPQLNTPTNTTITNGSTLFSRSSSNDTGAGFKEFTLFLATDSNFTNNILIQSTPNNESIIDTNSLPSGKIYWMIISSDEVTNSTNSDAGYFCNKQSCTTASVPSSNGSSSQGGGGGSITSAAKLAKLIEEAKKTEAKITENKPAPQIDTVAKATFNKEQINAYTYAYYLGITTQSPIQKAALESPLIRKDLAKMISEYAIKALNKKPDNTIICGFDDITGGDLEILYYTKLACKLGLMGRQANGIQKAEQFNPSQEVTRAQFSTIFSRLLYGNTYNIKSGEKTDRYTKHLQALNKNNIITKIDTPQAKELRGRVMTMMMRADKDASQKIGHASAK